MKLTFGIVSLGLVLAACGVEKPKDAEVFDRFNREDSRSSLGGSETNQPYIVPAGSTYGIYNNQAYQASSSAPEPIVVQTARMDGSVRISMPVIQQDCGLVFRYMSATSYWWFYFNGTRWVLAKVVNGTVNNVATFSQQTPANYNVLSVSFSGNKITPRVDNATYDLLGGQVTDDYNRTGTRHGFGCRVNNSSARFDNFAVFDS